MLYKMKAVNNNVIVWERLWSISVDLIEKVIGKSCPVNDLIIF